MEIPIIFYLFYCDGFPVDQDQLDPVGGREGELEDVRTAAGVGVVATEVSLVSGIAALRNIFRLKKIRNLGIGCQDSIEGVRRCDLYELC